MKHNFSDLCGASFLQPMGSCFFIEKVVQQQGQIQEFWLGGRESNGINRPIKFTFQIHIFYKFSYF